MGIVLGPWWLPANIEGTKWQHGGDHHSISSYLSKKKHVWVFWFYFIFCSFFFSYRSPPQFLLIYFFFMIHFKNMYILIHLWTSFSYLNWCIYKVFFGHNSLGIKKIDARENLNCSIYWTLILLSLNWRSFEENNGDIQWGRQSAMPISSWTHCLDLTIDHCTCCSISLAIFAEIVRL
jgi:hypothetical protein